MGSMTGKVAAPPAKTLSWGGDRALCANPVSPVDGVEAMRLYEISREICARSNFDLISETVAVWRSANHRQVLSYTAAHGENATQARTCAENLITAQAEAGFGQILAEPGMSTVVNGTFASGGLSTLHSRIKKALDPTGLFASA
tara:strand:- start:86 stop:517 length:432 start_codon:yes stop_codon:yes gene_type:complete